MKTYWQEVPPMTLSPCLASSDATPDEAEPTLSIITRAGNNSRTLSDYISKMSVQNEKMVGHHVRPQNVRCPAN